MPPGGVFSVTFAGRKTSSRSRWPFRPSPVGARDMTLLANRREDDVKGKAAEVYGRHLFHVPLIRWVLTFRMRVLLVEDERKISAYLRRGLEEAGHAVDQAYTGPEALRLGRSWSMTRSSWTSCSPSSTGSPFAPSCVRVAARLRSSCSPRETPSTTASRGSTPAPTTTS